MQSQKQLEIYAESIKRLVAINTYMNDFDLLASFEKKGSAELTNNLNWLYEMPIAEINRIAAQNQERSCSHQQYGEFVNNFEQNLQKTYEALLSPNQQIEQKRQPQKQSIIQIQKSSKVTFQDLSDLQIQ